MEADKKSFRSFEDLECWKACREVRRFIYKLVKKFPKEELYGLVQDMRRLFFKSSGEPRECFYGRCH